jgi:hypothetical protein
MRPWLLIHVLRLAEEKQDGGKSGEPARKVVTPPKDARSLPKQTGSSNASG